MFFDLGLAFKLNLELENTLSEVTDTT